MWCNQTKDDKDLKFLINNILDKHADTRDCFQPCSSLHFYVKLKTFEFQNSTKYGLYIQFEDTVETIKWNLAMTELSLLQGIGGIIIIGVGKEFLWVIILFLGILKISLSFVIRFCNSLGYRLATLKAG